MRILALQDDKLYWCVYTSPGQCYNKNTVPLPDPPFPGQLQDMVKGGRYGGKSRGWTSDLPFSLPPPQMLWLFASLKGAKAEEKKTGECSSNISSQSVWWFMHYQDSFKVWFKMECLKSLDLLLKNQMWSRRIKCNPSRLFPLQLLPVQSKDSETLPPPLTHSPPPPPLRGPWVNGSECHCEGTAKKQTPKGTSEVTFSLCGQVMKTFSL